MVSYRSHKNVISYKNFIILFLFRDDEELPRGEEIAAELLKAIDESRICLIILSENYACSRWCLEELTKIPLPQTEKSNR